MIFDLSNLIGKGGEGVFTLFFAGVSCQLCIVYVILEVFSGFVTSPPSLVLVDLWCIKKSIHSISGANVTQLQRTPLAGNVSNVENIKKFREPAEKFSMEQWTLALSGLICVNLEDEVSSF